MWLYSVNWDGYAQDVIGSRTDGTRRTIRVVRYFYEEKYGPIPLDKELDHICRVRGCVNPDHVEAVSHLENVRRSDNYSKGSFNRNKMICKNGHCYDSTNTYIDPKGNRSCRICRRDAARRFRANK
jgi:hypothetical protein